MTPFKSLFSPFKIGKMGLKNRIVMPPMATYFSGSDGCVNDRHIAYYMRRIKGGVGYITFEHTGILKQGRVFSNMALIDSDQQIPHFQRLVEAIHGENGKIVIQINHAGRQTSASITGSPIVAPSAIPCPIRKEMPHELDGEEIGNIINAFALAAGRVKTSGADGVEIHMAHGYLINQFLSPVSNKRKDDYGGNFDRRTKMAVQVLRAVRDRVGGDFPVICRLSADEYIEGGLKLGDTKEIAKCLELNGADALHVSACVAASRHLMHPPYYVEEGAFVHLAQGVKSVVKIPVIAVGRIRTPELANQIVEDGKADLVSMGRVLIADPYFPAKVLEGRTEEIVPCLSCNRCVDSNRTGGLKCAVNPETGREEKVTLREANPSRRVWIIGGGPAGMKAAEVAARRGHQVTLYEKRERLGGRFLLAAIPPQKQILKTFVDYMERKIETLPIKVVLGKPFEPLSIDDQTPDAVIVATGGKPSLPALEGIKESSVVLLDDAFLNPSPLGKKILVVGGGGIGSEAADYLSETGREVTLIEMRERLALDLGVHLQYFLTMRLQEKGVKILTSTKAIRFEKEAVWVEGPQGIKKLDGFDNIVIASGSIPDSGLFKFLKDQGLEVYVIGDALKPKELMEAVSEGQEVALNL